jgi:hypothetical protein
MLKKYICSAFISALQYELRYNIATILDKVLQADSKLDAEHQMSTKNVDLKKKISKMFLQLFPTNREVV